jgi:hypothetical protein
METSGSISIWFFVGVSLLVDGVLIFGAGIYQFVHPPVSHVVLFSLHANVWWGAVLAVCGAVFCFFHAPWRSAARR